MNFQEVQSYELSTNKNHLPDFLTGDLDEDNKVQVQNHIAGCPACREEFTNRTGRPAEIAQLQQEVRTMRQTLAVSLLEKSSAFERLQGVNLSHNLKKPDSGLLEALLETVNTDPNINVRLAAVDALYLFYDNPIVTEGVAEMLSHQTSPLIQVALIDLIVNMHERRAVESLKNLIQSETLDPDVKEHAQLGLQKIGM